MEEERNDKSNCSHTSRQILSYGITIETNGITPVQTLEEENELSQLGISAYGQVQFEKGIIKQVDSKIAEAEKNFQINTTKKEIENLQDEIKYEF